MKSSTSPAPGAVDADPRALADASFEAFYRARVDRVYRALAVTLADPDLAREATDEAMARAYQRWSTVAGYENPGGWVFRVGLNWATSWWRRARLHGGELPELAAPAADPVTAEAWQALRRLDVKHRTVVVCRILLDLSTAETALVLETPVGTVKSRLARALAALRASLSEGERP